MKGYLSVVCSILIVSWVGSGCDRNDRNTDRSVKVQAQLPLVFLSTTSCAANDTIQLTLKQALRNLDVFVNNETAKTLMKDSLTVFIPLDGSRVGVFSIIVSGLTATNRSIRDTLFIEVHSDIKPRTIDYQLLATYPHQTTSFTQGLEFHRGALYEGTGINGQSKLMKVNPLTGEIEQSKALAEQHFGEGITIFGDKIYQLTWKSGECFRYTLDFTLDKTFRYYTQGWGLTHTDTTLIVSDGSNRIYFYSTDFDRLGDMVVYDDKGPVTKLNELEMVNGFLLANVWETNRIVQIEIKSGKVVGELNLINLVPMNLGDARSDVLNGIAFNKKEGTLYVTGKNWPALYKLKVNGFLNSGNGRLL
ncbi:glutaminyl-peptide cyclotransferase [Dyadobacter sp. MSC1_007]|uniref:glutaminyl-peptide cyclotransferase n=1 Tax=Dyadobacter sp. MSC1_007 TaxID=2909264 RepID=UPI00202F1D1D|nr:glutaminyl-peptide cyclotransferase [Dyadobacter sp. MSC1_007]